MAEIHNNKHIFVCRDGHTSYEVSGRVHYRCKKLVVKVRLDTDQGLIEQPCRKKAIIMEKEFAQALWQRGFRAHRPKDRYLEAVDKVIEAEALHATQA